MSDWRETREYRVWRAKVIRRDKKCAVCSSKEKRHAHHLNHASHFPRQRFDVDNGVCLCGKCHSQYHNNYHRNTRDMCTKYSFANFLDLVKYIKSLNFSICYDCLEQRR